MAFYIARERQPDMQLRYMTIQNIHVIYPLNDRKNNGKECNYYSSPVDFPSGFPSLCFRYYLNYRVG